MAYVAARSLPIRSAKAPKNNAPEDLARKAGGDEQADLLWRQLPGANEHRQDVGDGQYIEGVEESRSPHDQAGFDVPWRDVQPFDSRYQKRRCSRLGRLHGY
jgi:hypothetical protein